MLLNSCLDVLRRWTSSAGANRKRKLSQKNSQKSNRAKNRKLGRNPSVEMDDDDGDEGSDESDGEELSPQDNIILQKALVSALKAFIQLVQNFSLRGSDSSIHKSIQVMAELIRPYAGLDNHINRTFTASTAKYPVELAYVALKQLCSGFQGNSAAIINVVYKQLMSSILMLGLNNKVVFSQTIPVAYAQCRLNSISFICDILHQHKDSAMKSARTLIQHLCIKTPDKTDYRSKVAESILTIMDAFDKTSYAEMIKWVGVLISTSKTNNRMMALEIFSLLLSKTEIESVDVPADLQEYLKHKHYIGYVVDRCSDNSSSVRSRAIVIFSQCVGSRNQKVVNACQSLFTPQNEEYDSKPSNLESLPNLEIDNVTPISDSENNKTPNQGIVFTGQTPFVNLDFSPVDNNLSDNYGVLSMLKRRSSDEKVFVRKSALQAFESLVRLLQNDCQMGVNILEERCRDPSLSVRKQAMQSLSSLLFDLPTCYLIQKAWLNGVLPLILDCETTLQEKCMKCLEEVLLQNLCTYNRSLSSQYQLTWSLLQIMAGEEEESLRRYFQRAVSQWARLKLIKVFHINVLKTHVGTEHNNAAWMMLSELSTAKVKFDCSFVVQFWNENCSLDSGNESTSTCKYVLKVLLNVAESVPFEEKQKLVADLSKRLLQFGSPIDLISMTMATIKKLTEDNKFEKNKLKTLCQDILKASDKYLSKLILSEKENTAVDEEKVICHLFTLGEVCQLHPAYPIKHILLVVQSIIASPCISDFVLKCSQGSVASQTNGLDNLSKTKSGKNHETLLHFAGSKLSSRVRGHAFITLGKFCLQNEDLAKKCVAALVRELETSSEEAIRNNVVFILCDLCIRYTTLVDQYIPKVATCLNDVSPLIRKQTMTLLTMLIQEDYLKWKGPLFYRFITTYLDEQIELQKFSEFCFVHCLLVRNPNIMFYHFIECIFYFNRYQKHPMYNRFTQDQNNKNSLDLRGRSKFDLRWRLYTFMLQHMTDEHKINLSGKLNQEILAGVVDGIIELDEDGTTVLQDSLTILGSKEIKISLIVNKQNEGNMDEEEMAAAVIAKMNKNLISKVMKKNLIENIVPIVTSLKLVLETKRSPVLKELMLYLRELIKDFKSEIQQILGTDKQLADEIEFDLRKFEEQQQQQQQQQKENEEQQEIAQKSPSPEQEFDDVNNNRNSNQVPVSAVKPGRNLETLSLSKKAILNSAKKSIERLQQINGEKRQSLRMSSDSSTNNSSKSKQDVINSSDEQNYMNRAISTPFVASRSKNVTFHSDQNISLTPPSPIRHNSPNSLRNTSFQSTSLNSLQDNAENVIHLSSPLRIPEANKVWNITPGRHRTKSARLAASKCEDEDENDIKMEEPATAVAGQTRRS
ncbi:condensin-2 complex subunit D3-like [Octopus vulgaris]|uniref:Condensin-2 complex subunit D3-like n=1 Tax=Octopus vulgaris TaxID=6645 RepID=A0AA36FH66_OCTVU|nr:condensin-2 complex subunit D3-like [Octopus vulgaris]